VLDTHIGGGTARPALSLGDSHRDGQFSGDDFFNSGDWIRAGKAERHARVMTIKGETVGKSIYKRGKSYYSSVSPTFLLPSRLTILLPTLFPFCLQRTGPTSTFLLLRETVPRSDLFDRRGAKR